jgi:uncharacterized membrane protein YphA (DoxX/SURF4 family)
MSLPRPVQIILRLILGGVFLYAAGDKILHPDLFAPILLSYQILPLSCINFVALWLPACELLVAVLVLLGIWVRAASILLSGLLVIFIAGIVSALARGINLHCGCFSTDTSGPARTWVSLWEEALLLALAVLLWSSYWDRRKAATGGPPSSASVRPL